MIDAINEGIRLGAILGKKLKIRGEEKDLILQDKTLTRLTRD